MSRIRPALAGLAAAAALLGAAAPADARFSWAVSGGGPGSDDADGIGSDPSGNLVISGGTAGPGGADIFAARYGPRGGLRWMRRYASTGADQAFDNDVDTHGNGLITGSFNRTVDFGGTTLVSRGGTRPRYGDAFLLKLGRNGNTRWVRQIGGTASDGGDEIVAGPHDDALVIGDTEGDVRFSSTVELQGEGGRDAWVARFRSAGSLAWARLLGGSGDTQSHGIGVDRRGRVLVTGEFQGEARIGSKRLESDGARPDVFVARLDRRGRVLWAKRFGDADREIGRGVAADARGNVYFSGEYAGRIQIGAHSLTAAGSDDMFLAKATPGGRILWVVSIGGPGPETGPELEVDRRGNAYLAGTFSGTARIGRRVLRSTGARGAFAAKLSPKGRLAWVAQSGPESPFATLGELTVGPRFVSVLGRYAGSVRLGSRTFTSAGETDYFIAGAPR
ncbi:MAG: SBBP repeat-containing protein [Thermoleophilaceae bacterium]|nr:SBBP repeat-containing protein [Thermoleophilaceae bacterium]